MMGFLLGIRGLEDFAKIRRFSYREVALF